jgi:hypothetical protein
VNCEIAGTDEPRISVKTEDRRKAAIELFFIASPVSAIALIMVA